MTIIRPVFWTIPAISRVDVQTLKAKVTQLDERLQAITSKHQQVRLAHSLAVEDMVIMDRVVHTQSPISIFTLDTGLLNLETYAFLERLAQFYPDTPIEHCYADTQKVEDYVQQYGKTAFYESVNLRKQCCHIRKVEPLNKALAQANAWLTGQRQSQSVTRQALPFEEWDKQRNIAKFNPIFDWSEEEVWAYIQHHQLPFNQLYRQGYPSIGCEPCTRPVKQGENIRAGRWWWESQDSKECGLHQTNLQATA